MIVLVTYAGIAGEMPWVRMWRILNIKGYGKVKVMETIDIMGRPCPIPIVEAKKAIARLPDGGGSICVRVDSKVSCDNLEKMAHGSGYGVRIEEMDDSAYSVFIHVGEGVRKTPHVATSEICVPAGTAERSGGTVVSVGTDSMGRGSDELGRVLVKGFIYAQSRLDTPPSTMLFFNSGVKLTLRDAATLEDLRELESRGCRILVCGTCVDYYHCKDDVAVGEITNMYGIVEAMNSGANVVGI